MCEGKQFIELFMREKSVTKAVFSRFIDESPVALSLKLNGQWADHIGTRSFSSLLAYSVKGGRGRTHLKCKQCTQFLHTRWIDNDCTFILTIRSGCR